MPVQLNRCNRTATFNKYGWHLRWPRAWIIFLGSILLFLGLCIAGVEIGHTLFDLYRSTAFGGLIIFVPLMICVAFILITACISHMVLLRIAVILSCLMIILCSVLIAYDILVLIDPTRCFVFDCTHAIVSNELNSTATGWPILITWPTYFQINMNAKRVFQSIQLLCAILFIVFCSLYILTYCIYREIDLHRSTIYTVDPSTFTSQLTSNSPDQTAPWYPHYSRNYGNSRYNFENCPSTLVKYPQSTQTAIINTKTSQETEIRTIVQPRVYSLEYRNQICRRCMIQPRMILSKNLQQENLFSYVCVDCNNELLNDYQNSQAIYSTDNSICTSY